MELIDLLYCISEDHGFSMNILELLFAALRAFFNDISLLCVFRASYGDTNIPFAIQACCMPLNYALALSDLGTNAVHNYVGFEPSGERFNSITLNHDSK